MRIADRVSVGVPEVTVDADPHPTTTKIKQIKGIQRNMVVSFVEVECLRSSF
jgi:hypothetical protein